MIFHIICMAMLFFQSLSIKRPNRISFPYRSMRDKSLSRLSCHSYSLSRRPIMPVIAIMLLKALGVRRKSKPENHCTAVTKTPWSKDTMTSYHF